MGFLGHGLGKNKGLQFQFFLLSIHYEAQLEASTDCLSNPYDRPVRQILVLGPFTDEETEAEEGQRLDSYPGTLAPRLVPLPSRRCC